MIMDTTAAPEAIGDAPAAAAQTMLMINIGSTSVKFALAGPSGRDDGRHRRQGVRSTS